jgi:hypothetical protein
MNRNKLSFRWETLEVDWLTLNIPGLTDPLRIANGLCNYFQPNVIIDEKEKISFHGVLHKYKVSVLQSTKGYWVGTQIIFSGKNAAYFYKLIQRDNFDWGILNLGGYTLNLGRIDLCFCRTNKSNYSLESLDAFLVGSRHHVDKQKKSRYFKIEDFPGGKMLKVNRRNNSIHYRVYLKDESVRFELELKHRETKLIQDHLFNNEFEVFEDKLVMQYFKSFQRILSFDYIYTDWIIDFQRRFQLKDVISPVLVTSYLENQIAGQTEDIRLFHLLQFLSFVKSLKLAGKDYNKYKIKKQNYYSFKFSLSKFVEFTGINISKHSQREKLLLYFNQLQTLDPIVKTFSDGGFRSYVCFPCVESENPSGNNWIIDISIAEELFCFPYPFNFPNVFLVSDSKDDLRLKVLFIKSLAVSGRQKTLDLEEFFKIIKLPNNNRLIIIKKIILQLLKELSKNKVIENELEIVLKSGCAKNMPIKDLTIFDLTRRIQHIKLYEIIKF